MNNRSFITLILAAVFVGFLLAGTFTGGLLIGKRGVNGGGGKGGFAGKLEFRRNSEK